MGRREESSSCRISITTGFILVFLSLAISVGVGLITVFALGQSKECRSTETGIHVPSGSSALEQQCIAKVANGDGHAVCNACKPPPTTTPKPVTTTPSDDHEDEEEEETNYRLPITVRPYLYAVELQPNIYGGDNGVFDFEGSVKISTRAEKVSKEIVLHARYTLNLTIPVSVRDLNSSSPVEVSEQTTDKKREFLILHLSEDLVVGHHYEIYAEFRAPLATDGRSLFVSHYMENGKKVYVVASHLEAPRARRIFPCFDEPALKAQFDITLVRRSGGERNYTTLANAPRLREETRPNGMVADVYERTVIMPTYLLAFVVSDFKSVENEASGVTYRTWANPSAVSAMTKAQQYGVELFNKLEERFGPDYPLSKIDSVAVPDFGPGAMENWGLVLYKPRLLYQPGLSTGADEIWIAEVISHELVHQWFGNLVSPKWWNWLWLNEALASFWDYQTVAELYPSWRLLDRNIVGSFHRSMTSDAKRSSHPMTPPEDTIQTQPNIRSLFDTITYSKGSQVVRMMDLAMGRDLFIKGLNRYLATHAYGNAEHQDLWDALTEEARVNSVNLNMTEIMDPWVTQMNFPVVNVEVSTDSIRLTQERFLSEDETGGEHDTAKYGYKWTIPITYTTSNNPNFTTGRANNGVTYLKVDQHQLQLSVTVPDNGWVIVNLQQCGYFRVNYDVTNWNNIINFLENGDHTVIHPINRAQIINDAWNLAMAGRLDLSIALRTLNYLHKEVEYAPWRAYYRQLIIGPIEDMLDSSDLYGQFQHFMKEAVRTAYRTLGSTVLENMPPYQKVDIAQIVKLACMYEYPDCVDTAVTSLHTWMNNQSYNSIPADLRTTFYCTAVRHGGQSQWTFVYDQYHLTDVDTEKTRLRRALACTREPYLLQRVLEMSLDRGEVSDDDMISVLTSVSDNRWGREQAWAFLVYNLQHISSLRDSASDMKKLISGVTSRYNTEQELQKVKKALEDVEDVDDVAKGLEAAVKKVEKNVDWMKKYHRTFLSWLSTHNA